MSCCTCCMVTLLTRIHQLRSKKYVWCCERRWGLKPSVYSFLERFRRACEFWRRFCLSSIALLRAEYPCLEKAGTISGLALQVFHALQAADRNKVLNAAFKVTDMELSKNFHRLEDNENGLTDKSRHLELQFVVINFNKKCLEALVLLTRGLSVTHRLNLRIWKRQCLLLTNGPQAKGRWFLPPLREVWVRFINGWQHRRRCRVWRGR